MSTPGSWEWAEDEAERWLKAKSDANMNFAWHRYPDSKAARNALGPQPSDYIVGYKGFATHLEVKKTDQATRLPLSKIRQYGKLKMFHEAGFQTIVLIYRSTQGDWIYLIASELFPDGDAPKSFPIGNHHKAFPTAAAALQEIFA